ncbi:signal peptidase I [Paenarthrobacter sp. NPDC090522]|uniref:signal peptidase I n=1 Tax=Paenarthrobacter sp. NPDC090522 TaxID=3364383 RepID=UPI00381C36DC
MSALTSINTPALHGRRSAAKPVQPAKPMQPAESGAPTTTAVKQSAAVLKPTAATSPAAVGVSTQAAPGAFRRIAGKTFKVVGAGMLVLAALVFVFLAIGPRILGYQTSTMLTGSMAPLINPGDVVVTVPTPVKDIKVGDIITYHIPVEDQRVETHRITEITTTADGGVAVQTKGDANNGIDPWIATLQGQTVDKQVATIPYVGNAIRALREPIVLNILMYGAPAVLVIGMLASIWTKDPSKASSGESAAVQAASGE